MFGRKKKTIPVEKKPDPWTSHDIDYLGFKYDNPDAAPNKAARNQAYGITSTDRTHMAIFGLPGSGKTSILKLLIYQNIMRGQGFMVIDPHGELARDVMSMIPEDKHEDVIYVNPASLYRFGKTIQINPLEVKDDNERYVVVMAFVNTLYNLYKGSWGPRLETVLRNAANALVESKDNNSLRNISEMITSEPARDEILKSVQSKNVKHFWKEIFQKQYSKDAGSSAYNKIDKILATPTVSAMFDATESSISVSDIIKNRRMLLVDLSTGTSDDIAQFLGSIFLNMLYVEAKRRIDVQDVDMADVRKNPFYVYVDEAHMFSNTTMSEMLRALRKFGIKVTIATQTCNAYEREFADEITGVCKTIITGRCDYNTAQLVRSIMPVETEELQRFPSYTFAMFSDEGGTPANAIFRARPIPFDNRKISDWKKVAKMSSERWGKDVAIEKYLPPKEGDRTLFSPLEAAIVHLMRFDQRDWYREELLSRIPSIFPLLKEREINVAIDKLCRDRYMKIMYPSHDDGDQNEMKKRFVLTEKTYNTYLSKAAGGQRAGGDVHRELIFRLMDINMNKHRYCVPDLGDKANDAADLLVTEPAVLRTKDGLEHFDPHNWSMTAKLAIEIEMDPTKHMAHSVKNYSKNFTAGCDVWFVCMDEKHREALEDAIREKHPDFKKCKMDVINPKRVIRKEAEFPRTYDETFSGVKVQSIKRVLRVTDEEKATKEPAKTHYDPEQLRVYNKSAKKSLLEKAEPRHSKSYVRDPAKQYVTTAGVLKEPPKFETAINEYGAVPMSPIEWDVYELINKGGFIARPDLIDKKLDGKYGTRAIYQAINELVKKRAIAWGKQTIQKKVDNMDGNGERRIKEVKNVLLPADIKPVKFGSSDHWTAGDVDKTQAEIRKELGVSEPPPPPDVPDELESDMPEPDSEPDVIKDRDNALSVWSPSSDDPDADPQDGPKEIAPSGNKTEQADASGGGQPPLPDAAADVKPEIPAESAPDIPPKTTPPEPPKQAPADVPADVPADKITPETPAKTPDTAPGHQNTHSEPDGNDSVTSSAGMQPMPEQPSTPEPVPPVPEKPTPEPIPEQPTQKQPEPVPEHIPEPAPEPVPEPVSEPVPEPAPEPAPEPVPEPTPEPAPEPITEPVPEPIPEQPRKSYTEDDLKVESDHVFDDSDLEDIDESKPKHGTSDKNSVDDGDVLEDVDMESMDDFGTDDVAEHAPSVLPRTVVSSEIKFDDYTDDVLMAMLSDEGMKNDHAAIKEVLRNRGML